MIILRDKEFSKKFDDEKKAKVANAASDALHLGAGVAIGSGIYKSGEAWGRARAMEQVNNFNRAIKAGRASDRALATGLALAATSAGAKIYANKKKKDKK